MTGNYVSVNVNHCPIPVNVELFFHDKLSH